MFLSIKSRRDCRHKYTKRVNAHVKTMERKGCSYELSCTFLKSVYESRTGPTCGLQDLLLLDGVDGTEESGNSETSTLPDKNSNSWLFGETIQKKKAIREIK